MKKFNEYSEVQTIVTELLELNKPVLLEKAQAEIAEAQKKEHERVVALLQRFPSELQPIKAKCMSLLEQYIEQRRGYVKSKISTSMTSFTNMFSSKKADPSEKMNINSLQESQSSASYQTAFSNFPADQYSLELYNKINAHINAMTDYDSTVKVMYALASLLTEENKSKSEHLMKTLESILKTLTSLTQYDVLRFTTLDNSKTNSYEAIQITKMPTIFRYYKEAYDTRDYGYGYYKKVYDQKIVLYGCQGKEWKTIVSYTVDQDSLDCPSAYVFLISGAHLPDGERFGQYIEENITESDLARNLNYATTALKMKIDSFIAYYPIHYFHELLDKNPALKSFYDALQELNHFDLLASPNLSDPFSIRAKIYAKALSMAQNLGHDYVALLDDTSKPKWNSPDPYRPLNSQYLMRDTSDNFFVKVLQTFTGNKFLSILSDKLKEEFTPVVNHESSSSNVPHM